MAALEHGWIWLILRSSLFCLSLRSRLLAYCRNLANHNFIGVSLAPLFYKEGKKRGGIPFKQLGFSFIILIGVVLMQLEHATELSAATALLCTIPILIASLRTRLATVK